MYFISNTPKIISLIIIHKLPRETGVFVLRLSCHTVLYVLTAAPSVQQQFVVYPLINLSPAAPLTPPTLLIVCVCVCVYILECVMCAGGSRIYPLVCYSCGRHFCLMRSRKALPSITIYQLSLCVRVCVCCVCVCVCHGSLNSPSYSSSSHHEFISSQYKQSVTSEYQEGFLYSEWTRLCM